MKTVIYTTVRAVIHHKEPFTDKFQVGEYIEELLDYASLPLGESVDDVCRLVSLEVIDDDIVKMNIGDDDA